MDYVQQAKASCDPSFYPKAEGALQRSLQISTPDNFVAMAGMGALEAARHNFTQALSWAQRAAAIDPYTLTVYGILGDAETQLGRYPEAYQATSKWSTWNRAHPRWPAPPTPGSCAATRPATADMQRALDDAATPADRAFTRYHLAELAFNAGDPDAALAQDTAGLREVPGDAALLEGKAKAEAALGDTAAAIADYAGPSTGSPSRIRPRVRRVAPVPGPRGRRGAGYTSSGRGTAVREQRRGLWTPIRRCSPPTTATRPKPSDTARPGSRCGRSSRWTTPTPGPCTRTATTSRRWTTPTRPPARHAQRPVSFHRGMIEAALGQNDAARADLTDALAINPHFNPLQVPVAHAELAQLAARP